MLTHRKYRGPVDVPAMLAVHEACRDRDQVDYYSVAYRVPNMSPEEYANDVALSLADGTDENVLLVEHDGQVIAHARLEWWPEWDAAAQQERTAYLIRAWVAPDYRRRGIGAGLLEWGEQRARDLDKVKPHPGEYAANATDHEADAMALLDKAGYQIRFLSPELGYDDLTNLPAPTTPAGFDIRPLEKETIENVARTLSESNAPADFQSEKLLDWIDRQTPGMIDFANGCDPTISRIAWHGEEVAALYLCRRKNEVGDVANVATNPRYRLRGLSRSLMFHCLTAMRDQGVLRARVFTGIGADRHAPPSGPYQMYLNFGFRLITFHNRYRKPIAPRFA